MRDEDIVIGSPEWKTLPLAKRAAIQNKRAGAITTKYVTEEEAKELGITFEDIPDPVPQPQAPVHKVTSRRLTREEAEASGFYGKFKENWEGSEPDQSVKDDTMPSDRNPRDPGVIVTKVREVEGTDYKVARMNPFGFWVVVGLESELGTFTDQASAKDAARKYLKASKQKEVPNV